MKISKPRKYSSLQLPITQSHKFNRDIPIGDTVHAGDTLLTINSTLNSGSLAEALSDLKRAEADRRLLLSDPKAEEVATKRADIQQAEAVYESSRQEFNRVKELHSKKLISDDDYERSVSQFKIAPSSWDAQKSELKLLKSAPKAAAVERIDADIEKLTCARRLFEESTGGVDDYQPL